jgi:hypothetical protein
MGVEYDDRPMLAEQKDEVAEKKMGNKPVLAKEEKTAKTKGQRRIVRKRKASELGDVRMGCEMARPSKKSRKFTLRGLGRDSDAADAGGVREGWCIVFLLLEGLFAFD